MSKKFYFVTGLPQSGSTLITNILSQNPEIHGEPISSLSVNISFLNQNWSRLEQNRIYPNEDAKIGSIKGLMDGYYSHVKKPIIIDNDRNWIPLIGIMEKLLQEKIKMIVCVRNPAEILASLEKIRKENSLFSSKVDFELGPKSNIASRCYYYSSPEGDLGVSHRNLNDAIIMGYLDRFLFVDYTNFCNMPKAQTKRIYEFLDLPQFDHDFDNIETNPNYHSENGSYPNIGKTRKKLHRSTFNCVEYLGIELYEQYNREIFWDAWV